MVTKSLTAPTHPLATFIEGLEAGEALLKDTPENVLEVVGILKSYGVVLDAYSDNLIYIAQEQFLELFPFFKYFNGRVSFAQLLRHWWHARINFEYAEYCMKTMFPSSKPLTKYSMEGPRLPPPAQTSSMNVISSGSIPSSSVSHL